MMKIHTLYIAITTFLMGLLCLAKSDQLVTTELGKTISLGLAAFWTMRFGNPIVRLLF